MTDDYFSTTDWVDNCDTLENSFPGSPFLFSLWLPYVDCNLLYNPCNRQVTDIPFLINITSSMCILNWFCWCEHDCLSSYFAPFLYPRVISWMIQSKRTCCLFGITQSSESQACLANDSLSSHATAESFNLE